MEVIQNETSHGPNREVSLNIVTSFIS